MDKDGGPAFPQSELEHAHGQLSKSTPGMTLRQWYAGQALAGLLAYGGRFRTPETLSKEAFRFADAMIEAQDG